MKKRAREARKGGKQRRSFSRLCNHQRARRRDALEIEKKNRARLVRAPTRPYLPVATPSGGPGCSIVVVRGLQKVYFLSRRRSVLQLLFFGLRTRKRAGRKMNRVRRSFFSQEIATREKGPRLSSSPSARTLVKPSTATVRTSLIGPLTVCGVAA